MKTKRKHKIPLVLSFNKETNEAIKELKLGRGICFYKNKNELFKKLEIALSEEKSLKTMDTGT